MRTTRNAPPPLDCDQPVARVWAVALWGVSAITLAGLGIAGTTNVLGSLDGWAQRFVISAEHPALVALAELLDIGDSVVAIGAVVLVVAGLLAWRRRWPGLVVWSLVVAFSQTLSILIKSIYERPRPPLPLVEAGSWSFPSGSTLTGAALAIALVLVWVPMGPRRQRLLVLAVAFACLMALSRVYLRVHWLSDVIAGLAIGGAIPVTVAIVASRWYSRSSP